VERLGAESTVFDFHFHYHYHLLLNSLLVPGGKPNSDSLEFLQVSGLTRFEATEPQGEAVDIDTLHHIVAPSHARKHKPFDAPISSPAGTNTFSAEHHCS
jgi:hypothetical protein